MELNEKAIKEISAIAVVLLFGVLVFFAIKPLIFAILWGMLLGYIFMPIYNKIIKYVGNDYLSAGLTLFLAILIILIPLWFITPIIAQQVFDVYKASQSMNFGSIIRALFPSASVSFVDQASVTLNTILGKLTSSTMNYLVDSSLNIPTLILDLVIIAFVFFFTLKDAEKLKEFVRSVTPLSKSKEKIVVKQFKDITYSTIYGRFVVGITQGLLSGLGFLVFGIHNALLLTMISMFLAVLPSLGVYLIWIPIAIYMAATGNIAVAIAFVLYNMVIVSNIDNLLFAYIVSKRTTLSPLFAIISSIGGLYLFGIIGLVIGPLIFAYFIILVDLYRNRNLLDLFSEDEPVAQKTESK